MTHHHKVLLGVTLVFTSFSFSAHAENSIAASRARRLVSIRDINVLNISAAQARPNVARPVVIPTPVPSAPPQVIQGWLENYSAHIRAKVSAQYPDLINLSAARMQTVCPNWTRLDRNERTDFWAAILWSIAKPESNRNRTLIYLEGTMSTDSVTGQQIRSEGLLQLSYSDVPNYKYKGGDISWAADKTMALADYAAKAKSGHPNRTLLNAYANLNLGLWIMYKQLLVFKPSATFEDATGRYWYTMKKQHAPFKTVMKEMKKKIPECFPQ